MNPITANFPRAWFAPELPGYRETPTTYGHFDYDALPPIMEKLNGDFAWLTQMDERVEKEMLPHWQEDQERAQITTNLERVVTEVTIRGFALPDIFLRFMRSEFLQKRIPSCTACYFDAPDRAVEAPAPGAGVLVRFMNDQQWCILWYLYVEKSGAHAVLASARSLDVDDELDESEDGNGEPSLYLCAQNFEMFLYRIWLENNAWFVLHEKHRPFSPAEERYLAHLCR
jgi:hypothetical protein